MKRKPGTVGAPGGLAGEPLTPGAPDCSQPGASSVLWDSWAPGRGPETHSSPEQQPSQNCCPAGVPRTGSCVSGPTQLVMQAQPGSQKWPGLCLLGSQPSGWTGQVAVGRSYSPTGVPAVFSERLLCASNHRSGKPFIHSLIHPFDSSSFPLTNTWKEKLLEVSEQRYDPMRLFNPSLWLCV